MSKNISGCSQDIECHLLSVLEKNPPSLLEVQGKLLQLEARYGIDVYAEFLYLLCHLQFPPREAKEHWERILHHLEFLEKCKERKVDFRVALLDYFLSVNRRMRSPTVIEIKIFKKTQDSAIRDELTGLFNYRHFRTELPRELERARRNGQSISLCFFDIDGFKGYNDRNGHRTGDRALQIVGRIIAGEVRKSDLAARYGGEEFAVILPGTGKAQAMAIAERIRKRIEERDFPGQFPPGGRMTLSGGVATFRVDARDADDLLETADRALYLAKGRGKNRIAAASNEFREFPRIAVKIPGTARSMVGKPEPFWTQDVSEKGFSFQCPGPLEKKEYFLFTLRPSRTSEEIGGIAQVLRSEEIGGLTAVAARIVEMSQVHTKRLADFLARRVRRATRKKRLALACRG